MANSQAMVEINSGITIINPKIDNEVDNFKIEYISSVYDPTIIKITTKLLNGSISFNGICTSVCKGMLNDKPVYIKVANIIYPYSYRITISYGNFQRVIKITYRDGIAILITLVDRIIN